MKEREIYFLFTDTGTNLAKLINFFTKQELNHVSISFTKDFQTLYSFGRKRPHNPFIGGFIHEDITSDFLRNADCAIYSQTISEQDYRKMMKKLLEIEARRHEYRYNFLGLLGILFRVKIKRRTAFFCSEFVATVIQESEQFTFRKPIYFITPVDIRNHEGNQFIYEGKLKSYQAFPASLLLKKEKQSFLLSLTGHFKRLGIK